MSLSTRFTKALMSSRDRYCARPMLTVKQAFLQGTGEKISYLSFVRIRSAATAPASMLVTGMITVNSSPP